MSSPTATLKSGEQTVEIKLAHSPDSDDAFMFYALATHKLPTPGRTPSSAISTFLWIAAPVSAKAMAPWWSPPNP